MNIHTHNTATASASGDGVRCILASTGTEEPVAFMLCILAPRAAEAGRWPLARLRCEGLLFGLTVPVGSVMTSGSVFKKNFERFFEIDNRGSGSLSCDLVVRVRLRLSAKSPS